MKSLITIGLLVATLVFLLPAVQGATTLGYCAGVMNYSGYYELNQTVLDTGTNCFLINTSDIYFDCKGFSIDAQGSTSGSAFNTFGTGFSNITVHNCHVEDFDIGFYFQNITDGGVYDSTSNSANENGIKFAGGGSNLMFQNITITDCCSNEAGIDTYGTGGITFYNIVVNGSAGHGINVRSASNNFTNVVVADFTWRGIFFPTGGSSGTFTNIEIYGSGSAYEGIKLQQGNGGNIFNGLSIHNIDTTGLRAETGSNVFNNINISYNAGDGIYADECDSCNITGAYIIENDGEGIYWRDNDNTNLMNIVSDNNTAEAIEFRTSTNSYIYNVTSIDNGGFISLTTSSNGNVIDLVTSTGSTANRDVYVSASDNNVFTNIHSSTGNFNGVEITGEGTNNTISDSSFTDFDLLDVQVQYCQDFTLDNVTGTGGYPIIYHNSDSAYNISDSQLSELVVCYSKNIVLDNLTVVGNDNDGVLFYHVASGNVTGSNFTDYYYMAVVNSTVNITDTSLTSRESRGTLTIGTGSVFNLTRVTSTGLSDYGVSISSGSSGEIWDSTFYGNNSAIRLSNYDGNVSVDVYDSTINRTQDDSGNGAIRLYCSYYNPSLNYGCNDTNTANLFNTTLKDYSVTNSTLNIYWYLGISNPLGANVVLKDAFDTTIDTFTDTSKSFALLQYVITPIDNQTYTPHSLDMTKDGYTPKFVYVTMNESGQYIVSLELIGGFRGTLGRAGAGLGGFLTAIQNPVVNIILALGIIGGILAIFYGIASVIKRAVGGATTTI